MEIERFSPDLVARLKVLAVRLANASAREARRRRRLGAALDTGRDVQRRTEQLDTAVDRVIEIAAEIERLVAEADLPFAPEPPQTRPARSDGRRARRPARPAAAVEAPLVAAAVDIGSNSVHLLVAVVRGHRLQPLLDVSEFLGLGAAVDDRGAFGPELRERLVDTLRDYVGRARTLGALRIVLVGTDPMRRAADGADASAGIEAATGLPVMILDHQEEAYLTLLGVTAGRPVLRDLVLVDLGGGSSEVLVVPTQGDPVAVGLPTGSARLTRQIVEHDPPTPAELEALLAESRRVVAAAPEASPADVIVVGGTASNLLRVIPAAALDHRLSRRRMAEAMAVLTMESAADAAARHGIREVRAKTMAAGAAIVAAVMERYAVDRVRVLDVSVREGLVLAIAHTGDEWRARLAWLAHGWTR